MTKMKTQSLCPSESLDLVAETGLCIRNDEKGLGIFRKITKGRVRMVF